MIATKQSLRNKVKIIFLSLLGIGTIASAQADTIGNYMTIVNNIPEMSVKPDEQSQAWVRSARSMIGLADQTMAQTILSMNAVAAKQGSPIYCFPANFNLDAAAVDDIIQKTYGEWVKSQQASPSMPASDVLLAGMAQYACSSSQTTAAAFSPQANVQPAAVAATPPSVAPATMPSQGVENPILPPPAVTPTATYPENNPYATAQQVAVSAEPPPIL